MLQMGCNIPLGSDVIGLILGRSPHPIIVEDVYNEIHPIGFLFAFQVLQLPSVQLILDKVDQLGLLLAALCHDLDHDGHSNSFHILTQV